MKIMYVCVISCVCARFLWPKFLLGVSDDGDDDDELLGMDIGFRSTNVL